MNKDFKYQNQYYVQNTFSTPTATFKEFYYGGNKFTGTGTQIKNPKPLKNQDGSYTDNSVHEGVFPQPGDNAILGRGKKKDFFDIAELLKHFRIPEIIEFYEKKFSEQRLLISIPQAITYFEDADNSEDPVSLNNQTWEDVKSTIRKAVNDYLK
jgi:hypothetical protein